MTVTLHDVARLAGVSIKTVSNVVHDYPHVRAQTRERVLSAIRELDYRPNLSARGLRLGRTGVIGLAVPALRENYFAELADAVIRAAERRGLIVLIEQTNGDRETELRSLSGGRLHLTDGLLFSPVSLGQNDVHALEVPIPLVLLGERIFGGPTDHVTMHNTSSARAAVEHLLELGRTRIALIGASSAPDDDASSAHAAPARIPGGPRGRAGLPRIPSSSASPSPGIARPARRPRAACSTRGSPSMPVFALNDTLGLGVLRALGAAGVSVPDDVAVIGFDNIEESRFSVPSLSSVDSGREEIAEVAVELLLERIREKGERRPPRLVKPDFRIVGRESTGETDVADVVGVVDSSVQFRLRRGDRDLTGPPDHGVCAAGAVAPAAPHRPLVRARRQPDHAAEVVAEVRLVGVAEAHGEVGELHRGIRREHPRDLLQAHPARDPLRAVADGAGEGALHRAVAHPEPGRQRGARAAAHAVGELDEHGVRELQLGVEGSLLEQGSDRDGSAADARAAASAAASIVASSRCRRASSAGVTGVVASARSRTARSLTTASPAGRSRIAKTEPDPVMRRRQAPRLHAGHDERRGHVARLDRERDRRVVDDALVDVFARGQIPRHVPVAVDHVGDRGMRVDPGRGEPLDVARMQHARSLIRANRMPRGRRRGRGLGHAPCSVWRPMRPDPDATPGRISARRADRHRRRSRNPGARQVDGPPRRDEEESVIEAFGAVNWWAAALGALAYFVLGALWFSPLFGRVWDRAVGHERRQGERFPTSYYVVPLVSSIAIAAATAWLAEAVGLLGRPRLLPDGRALFTIALGVGVAAAVSVTNAMTPNMRHPFVYGAVTGGYHFVGIGIVTAIMLAFG